MIDKNVRTMRVAFRFAKERVHDAPFAEQKATMFYPSRILRDFITRRVSEGLRSAPRLRVGLSNRYFRGAKGDYGIVASVVCRLCLICVFVTSLDSIRLYGQEQSSASVVAKGERGLTGSYEFTYAGKPLQAKIERNNEAPISIRLIRSSREGTAYQAKFIGTMEGTYDLREHLEHADGSIPSGLSNMPVQIFSTLPNDHRSDLFETGAFKPSLFGGYRFSIGLLGLAWIAIPIFLFVQRAMRKKPVVILKPGVSAPTLAEQLHPLVEAAASRSLSIQEKGRLELLLYRHWRERAELKSTDMAFVIRQLRSHPEAGQLIGTLERWLHESDSRQDPQERSPEAIVELLKPYRSQPAIQELPIHEEGLTSQRMQTASAQRMES